MGHRKFSSFCVLIGYLVGKKVSNQFGFSPNLPIFLVGNQSGIIRELSFSQFLTISHYFFNFFLIYLIYKSNMRKNYLSHHFLSFLIKLLNSNGLGFSCFN